MNDKFFINLGQIMDELFNATRDIGSAFKDGFGGTGQFEWDEKVDFYPAYSYPPANVYITKEKQLIFEFALAGFGKENINLLFKGDYMILSVTAPEQVTAERYRDVRFFKRRLKLKAIAEQKYYVPANRFNRRRVEAAFKNGLLRVVIPPDENFTSEEGIHINIKEEDKG